MDIKGKLNRSRKAIAQKRCALRFELDGQFLLVLVRNKPSAAAARAIVRDLSYSFDVSGLSPEAVGHAFMLPAPSTSGELQHALDDLVDLGWTVTSTPPKLHLVSPNKKE